MDSRYEELYCGVIKGKKIRIYRSTLTALTVTLIDTDGPVVSGYFTLATEESSHDGLPHTLEHLIFLGSEKYPYKGVLDLAANQCFAQGTNAWTSIDHTAYTVQTAGLDGFLILLPIYLDHILFPTLTEQGYTTEVHHVNGDGEDAGVVYCEMQARENNASSREEHALQEAAYKNDSGYKWETGGLMENLRTSCSNEKVKAYHKKFYRPENLNIIICGKTEIKAVVNAIAPIEKKLENRVYGPYEKPWTKPMELFTESKTVVVEFPSSEEDTGRVSMTWKGPDLLDVLENEKHYLFWKYLKTTSASPLVKALVDIPEPLCTHMDFSSEEYPKTIITITFKDTTAAKQHEIQGAVFKVLKEVQVAGFDMNRMQNIIKNRICNLSDSLENDPSETLAEFVILDHLYGDDKHNIISKNLKIFDYLEELRQAGEDMWRKLIPGYLEDPSICIISVPSIKCMNDLETTEKKRVEQQKERIGEDGMGLLQAVVDKACEFNDLPIQDGVMEGLPKPSLKSMNFHPVESLVEVKPGLHFHKIQSDFCRFLFTFDTKNISEESKKLLIVNNFLFCDTPIVFNGKELSYEDVIKTKERLFQSASCSTGHDSGFFSEHLVLQFKFLYEDYEECKLFMAAVMNNQKVTEDRVTTAVNKISSQITPLLRKARTVMGQLDTAISFSNGCKPATNLYTQKEFMNICKENITKTVSDITQLQKDIFRDSEVTLHVISNEVVLNKIDIPELQNLFPLTPTTIPCTMSNNFQKLGVPKRILHALSSDESSYMQISVPSFKNYGHTDDSALKVFYEYVGQLEGILWKQIRGQGFAYNYNCRNSVNLGYLIFNLGKATNITKGYLAARTVIQDIMQPGHELDQCQIDTAKGAVVFSLIEHFSTPYSTAFTNICNIHKGVPLDSHFTQLNEIVDISDAQLFDACSKYYSKLFSEGAQMVVCCTTNKREEIIRDMEEIGLKLEEVEDVEKFIKSETS